MTNQEMDALETETMRASLGRIKRAMDVVEEQQSIIREAVNEINARLISKEYLGKTLELLGLEIRP